MWLGEAKSSFLPKKLLEEQLHRFLREDLGHGDITTSAVIPANVIVEAEILAKQTGVVGGIEEAIVLCRSVELVGTALVDDGERVKSRTPLIHVRGDARTILSVERTLVNLLSRMSGIATATRGLVDKVERQGYNVRVACTRKVAPGLAYFDKKAVLVGGGDTHRFNLNDLVLIKDNHIKIVGSVKDAVEKARATVSFSKKVEVEVGTLPEALEAAEAGADIVMLDNFSPVDTKKTILALTKKGLRNKVLVEASGGITETNIIEYASANVDIISVGRITHSAPAFDISLEITETQKPEKGDAGR
jgi:nicotinate-nucleotide pyrophosphorylase (carboxylating)